MHARTAVFLDGKTDGMDNLGRSKAIVRFGAA